MLKKLAALLQKRPFPAPKEEVVEISSLSEQPKKPSLKKATTRKAPVKKTVAKNATTVAKKKTKPKNVG